MSLYLIKQLFLFYGIIQFFLTHQMWISMKEKEESETFVFNRFTFLDYGVKG